MNITIASIALQLVNQSNSLDDTSSVKETYGKHLPIMQTVIPATVCLAEISTANHSIYKHEPKGRAAEAYRSLTKEVIDIGEKQRSRSANITR